MGGRERTSTGAEGHAAVGAGWGPGQDSEEGHSECCSCQWESATRLHPPIGAKAMDTQFAAVGGPGHRRIRFGNSR